MTGNKTVLLTQQEIVAAIEAARIKKYHDHGTEILSNREVAERLFWRDVKIMNPNFEINDDNADILELLFQYFSFDPKFEQDGRSLSKGIMLAGPVGCGKTTILSAFRVNGVEKFTLRPCFEIVGSYRSGNTDIINYYSSPNGKPSYYNIAQATCFDDLGTEDVVKEYGNTVSVIAEIIQNRYKNFLHRQTHFTTNLGGSQIEDLYGTRIKSRLMEMVNFIPFSPQAEDQRKRN